MRHNTLVRKTRLIVEPPQAPLESQPRLVPSSYFCWKGVLDRVLSAILLVPGTLFIGLFIVLTRLTSRGPGIYRQLRTGKDGKMFWLYKIRTMRHDAEESTGPVWPQAHDPRITWLGWILRRLHLDELPQLLNVLKGEMSLVGPRPERPEFVRVLAEVLPGYHDRLMVPPGITGLAQVNLPPDSDLASVHCKLVLDCEYIERGSLWLDLRLLICTSCRVLKLPERWLLRLFGLSRKVTPPQFLKELSSEKQEGAERAAPTPISILVEAASVPTGKGNLVSGRSELSVRKLSSGGGPLSAKMLNVFTVDVEDYYHVSAFEKCIPRQQWDRWESRVEVNTRRILRLLDRYQVKATFFVLGWVGKRHPQLVQEIHSRGHEIGSHGYEHRLVFEQTPDQFREDLQRSRDLLQDVIGERITAYRAPSFSITGQSRWALEILVEEGFLVDSSVFPIHHDRYGIPDAAPRPHFLTTEAGPLWEFPPAVVRLAGMNVPVAGGGYFRLYPLAWTLYCLRRINETEQRPFTFYVHPWELDPKQPRIPSAPWLSRFRHYVNLSRNEEKLAGLLQRFHFGRLCDVVH
ncbi:MAG: sugar transferase [Pirellulales bacterium]|nr:sugar transferase [Pirellulales bacterium]